MKKEQVNIFIHRRDLRIHDNLALNMLRQHEPDVKIFHIFIFNPDQINPSKNKYFSKNSVEFLVQCLHDLDMQLDNGLHCFYGQDIEVLSRLLRTYRVNNIAFNTDFTPFAKQRDSLIKQWCQEKNISCLTSEDYTLFSLDTVLSEQRKTYEVFTPFYRKSLTLIDLIPQPHTTSSSGVFKDKHASALIKNIDQYYFNEPNHKLALKGGRQAALDILQRVAKGEFMNYDKYRDFPAMDRTTKLSPYLKYGCISIREMFWTARKRYGLNHGLVRELFWREFYANVTHAFPKVLSGQVTKGRNHAFKQKYDGIKWKYDQRLWDAFVNGKTGYPMVDAGIRQLKVTGWCHNRSRMIIAMFASKDLHLPPNDIERWFASNLVDYDPSSNSGGVQWAYGIGSDAQPYFRIFNPFVQGSKYDPDASYIKMHVQELRNVSTADIHQWNTAYIKHQTAYPQPIVNHQQRANEVKEMFKNVSL
jgi:deoxyribodipyrimidine photo-lyase